MRRDLCTRCCALLILTALLLLLPGCQTQKLDRWVKPDALLFTATTQEIKDEFLRLYSGQRNPSDCFIMQQVQAANTRYLFVTVYPYRGPIIVGVYCFEQVNSDAWHLRAVAPILEGSTASPTFLAEGDSVKIWDGRKLVFSVESVADRMQPVFNKTNVR